MSERVVVLVGVSGGGKTMIAEELERLIGLKRVTTCTTREPRPGEIHGKHYYFLSVDDFQDRVKRGEFAEHDPSRKDLYGTLREDIDRQINSSELALLVMNIAGAKEIARQYPGAQVFFITAPIEQLLRRLDERPMSEKSRKERKEGLLEELRGATDHCVRDIILNTDGNLSVAVQQIIDTIVRRTNSPFNGKPLC